MEGIRVSLGLWVMLHDGGNTGLLPPRTPADLARPAVLIWHIADLARPFADLAQAPSSTGSPADPILNLPTPSDPC